MIVDLRPGDRVRLRSERAENAEYHWRVERSSGGSLDVSWDTHVFVVPPTVPLDRHSGWEHTEGKGRITAGDVELIGTANGMTLVMNGVAVTFEGELEFGVPAGTPL